MSHPPLLDACKAVLAEARHVSLAPGPLRRMIDTAPPALLDTPDWRGPGMLDSHPEDVITWLVTHNAVNFSYWPEAGQRRWFTQLDGELIGQDDEAFDVLAAIGRAVRSGVPLGDWGWLARIDMDDLGAILAPAPGAGPLPMLDARLAALRELGAARRFVGSPAGLFEQARGSAARFVDRLVQVAPTFEDTARYGDITVPFRKRAWLCAAMLYGRFQDDHIRRFRDPEVIPVFSDYRLPQLLRGAGAMVLTEALADRIDAAQELPAGSPEEVELRAASVVAAEGLRLGLCERLDRPVLSLEVDHFLWRTAVNVAEQLPPFHRTRTTAY